MGSSYWSIISLTFGIKIIVPTIRVCILCIGLSLTHNSKRMRLAHTISTPYWTKIILNNFLDALTGWEYVRYFFLFHTDDTIQNVSSSQWSWKSSLHSNPFFKSVVFHEKCKKVKLSNFLQDLTEISSVLSNRIKNDFSFCNTGESV